MKLFKSFLTVAAAFGAGFLAHRILTENEKEYDDQIDFEELEEELDELLDAEGDDAADEDDCETDPKLIEAVDLVVSTNKASTSLLQRRLGIGYVRAANMIDVMEKLGYVGPCDGHSPRKVLLTAEVWEEARKDLGEFLCSNGEA